MEPDAENEAGGALGRVRSRDADAGGSDLRSRLEFYEQALQVGGIGAWEWDIANDTTRWSAQFEMLMGFAPGTFDGRFASFLRNVHPDDVEMVRTLMRESLAGVREHDAEFRIRGGTDGAERWMHSRALIVRDESGEPLRVVGSQVDVTDRKAAELRARETTDLLEYVLDTSPIVLFAGRIEGEEFVPTYASSNSERVQGWSAEAFRTGAVSWKELLHPDDRERVIAANVRALELGHSEWETRLRAPDGTYGSYRTVLRVNRDEDGRATYVGCTLDVTASHEMEQQLRQAQKMEAVGQLAGGVAHDFNNLLLAISGYTEVARAAAEPGGAVEVALAEVTRATRQAGALVQQLLTFSRREDLYPVSIDVGATLTQMRELLDTTAGETVRLRMEMGRELCCVRLGGGQLEQMVLNLVVNARDAMPFGGQLTIAAEAVELGDDDAAAVMLQRGRYVRIAVTDTGEGMEPDVLGHVFEPFFTTKAVGAGTGLGLATVYGVVSKAGGHARIESEPGEGTMVELLLPLYDEEADVVPADSGGTELGQWTGQARAEHVGASLLLVEDQPQVRALLTTTLTQLGYAVRSATDGADALAQVERDRPELDLLITDVVMPGLNGIELADRLRHSHPDLAVLFMSGYADTAEGLRRADGRGFLQKPFSLRELAAEVGRMLAE